MIVDPLTKALKVALKKAWQASGMTKVELACRLGCHENEVRRILDPDTMTKLPRLEQAGLALGLRIVVRWEPSPVNDAMTREPKPLGLEPEGTP